MANPCLMKSEVVRARLRSLGISQVRFAEGCNLEPRTFQRWIAGQRVSVEDAERVAAGLGVGTDCCFEGVPERHYASLFTRLRPLVKLLARRGGDFSMALNVTMEHYAFIDEFVSFTPHPRRGFVARRTPPMHFRHGFAILHIEPNPVEQPEAPRVQRFHLRAQAARRFSFHLATIELCGQDLKVSEHFHARSFRGKRAADGSFDLWIWISPDMKELVLHSEQDFLASELDSSERRDLFPRGTEQTRHAVCTRPSPLNLRSAGLPADFDRVLETRAQLLQDDDALAALRAQGHPMLASIGTTH